jgi:hypothetical protein
VPRYPYDSSRLMELFFRCIFRRSVPKRRAEAEPLMQGFIPNPGRKEQPGPDCNPGKNIVAAAGIFYQLACSVAKWREPANT